MRLDEDVYQIDLRNQCTAVSDAPWQHSQQLDQCLTGNL